MKTKDLIDKALDYAVAVAEGYDVAIAEDSGLIVIRRHNVVDYFDPSTNFGWGGPILVRENIRMTPGGDGTWYAEPWNNGTGDWDQEVYEGPSFLVAAMRCYVASRLGDKIDLPEGL
jgi:hypothetical protein